MLYFVFFFFFQAEDGIRDKLVTGVQTCALPILMTPIAVAIVGGLGKETERTAEATLLGVAYAASLGGIGTPIGTPTNLIFLGAARELFPLEKTVTFAQWMFFGGAYLVLLVQIGRASCREGV